MATFATARDALQVLASHVRGALAARFGDDTAAFGGVEVVIEEEESPVERVGVPCLVLGVEDDAPDSAMVQVPTARDCTASFRVEASEFNGARMGAANPQACDVVISRALAQILREDEFALGHAGLYALRQTKARREVTDDEERGPMMADPHRIEFTYFVPTG